ncbi:MAG: hypothetical protein HKN24_04395 [Acidimicrobiales bacterium]|nr:hypothetical protein [Acidimicrobiales bacterium]
MIADVASPHFRNERSVDIAALPEDVWPWLVQMGFGRAGWYSWDIIDNLGRRSATELHPEWMIQRAGDTVPGGPIEFDTPVVDAPEHLVIAVVDRRLLVWTIDFMLSYRLNPVGQHATKLTAVATGSIQGPSGGIFARYLLGPGDAFMVRKQLAGIKQRAEGGG